MKKQHKINVCIKTIKPINSLDNIRSNKFIGLSDSNSELSDLAHT